LTRLRQMRRLLPAVALAEVAPTGPGSERRILDEWICFALA
jgi:hypothetical protein